MTPSKLSGDIGAILEPLGFVRRKMAWNRRSHGFIDIIDLQRSKSGDSITMNVGVMHIGVHQKTWGEAPPAFADEASSTVRARLGHLIDGKDLWWSLTNLPTRDHLDDLCAHHVLPFLDRTHSVEGIERHLMSEQVEQRAYPLPRIHLALLRFERGDKEAACALLSEMRSNTAGAWLARIRETAKRISCDPSASE